MLCAYAPGLHAFVLTMGGPDVDSARALYATDANGATVLIAELGMAAPGGNSFTDFGLPWMMPDGKVLFAAAVIGVGAREHWDIFVGDPNSGPSHEISRALSALAADDPRAPRFRFDPRPIADNQGAVAFVASRAEGGDALLVYRGGELHRLAASGDRTRQGHGLRLIAYGTVRAGLGEEKVFSGVLEDGRHALLLASQTEGLREIAVEGDPGPDNLTWGRDFGPPTAVAGAHGTLVAFANGTRGAQAVYQYQGGTVRRLLALSQKTALGKLTFISTGQPGLLPDGSMAVRGACGDIKAIFRVRPGRVEVIARTGALAANGSMLLNFTDPALNSGGRMLLAATDSDEHEGFYFSELGPRPRPLQMLRTLADPYAVSSGSLTTNQRGDLAYLGRSPAAPASGGPLRQVLSNHPVKGD